MVPLRRGYRDSQRRGHSEHLSRVFDERVAVRDVSLSVNAGEIVTLLGPNGAARRRR
jgi:ABC-type lipopolysaccharide export system ATPase subunit